MALTSRNRTILYENLIQLIPDTEAVEQMLSYFPARDIEEPLTREYLDARLAETQLAIESNLDRRMEERFALQWSAIESRFDQIDARFAQMDARFAQVDKRHEQTVQANNDRFAQMDKRIGRLEDRLTKVDERLSGLEVSVAEGFRDMQRWFIGTGLAVAGTVAAGVGVVLGVG